jgi:hypothetical protein
MSYRDKARLIAIVGVFAVGLDATLLAAQVSVGSRSALWVGSPLDDYVRLLQLSGQVPLSSRMLRPMEAENRSLTLRDSSSLALNPWRARYGSRQDLDSTRIAIETYDPIVRLTENSAVPFGTNDGALWAGRGLSGALDLGAAIKYRGLTVRLAPTLTYSQNAEFTLGALHPRYLDGSTVPYCKTVFRPTCRRTLIRTSRSISTCHSDSVTVLFTPSAGARVEWS